MQSVEPLGARIAQFLEEARSLRGDEQPPEGLVYGHLRVFCSEDLDEIVDAGGTFSIIYPMRFKMGYPFRLARAEFEQRMGELRSLTSRAHEHGVTILAYVGQNQGTSDPSDVWSWGIAEAWRKPEQWERYADLYGPRPEQSPEGWLQRKEDGSFGVAEWVPPSRPDRRSYSFQGCPHSPGFRQYVLGIMNLLVSAGIDGIYWDNSEIINPFSEDSKRCFREFLSARYNEADLAARFGLTELADAAPTRDRAHPLWSESTLFRAASQVEFHRHLRDHARTRDPDFIVSGNLFAPPGFQHAVVNGADIQIGAAVHGYLYSELAAGTRTPEDGQRNLPGIRDGVRTAVAPLNKMISASSRTGAATTYSHYPESPSPIPTREALYNLQRLAVAEAHANHVCFRRVEHHHTKEVQEGAKNVYDLLRRVEPDLLGAEMAANVGVVASLQNVYQGRYSYHLEVSRALADAGIAHELVVPRNLEAARLSRYRALILPNTAVLSDEDYEAILAWHSQGGHVIAFGEVGTLDPRGDSGPALRSTHAPAFDVIDIDLQKLAEDNALRVEDLWKRQEAWGKGIWPDRLRPTMEGVVGAVERAAGQTLTVRRHSPREVEITVMRRPNRGDLIVHVVNYGVDLAGEVTPARNVTISVAAPDDKPIKAVEWRALDGIETTLKTEKTESGAEFTIPEVPIYGIALVRFGSA
ncbi:MAG: hypothetical protein JXA57_05575 [Armatimonadetes bacterium]|nr:hypothetical protein [Armatimonadota bacterium]